MLVVWPKAGGAIPSWDGAVANGGFTCITDGAFGRGVAVRDGVISGIVSWGYGGVGGGSVSSGGDSVVKTPAELQALRVLALVALTFQ